MSKSLRPERARQFAARYIQNGFNGSQTVVDCGWTQNRNSAHVTAYRLLRNATVIAEVEKELKRVKLSADEVLEELSAIARAPVNKYTETAKLKALELTGKAHKLFTDRVEQVTEDVSTKRAIEELIAEGFNEAELQTRLQDDDELSPIKHPELWPSGCLLVSRYLEKT